MCYLQQLWFFVRSGLSYRKLFELIIFMLEDGIRFFKNLKSIHLSFYSRYLIELLTYLTFRFKIVKIYFYPFILLNLTIALIFSNFVNLHHQNIH
jgi:hypothetical protein